MLCSLQLEFQHLKFSMYSKRMNKHVFLGTCLTPNYNTQEKFLFVHITREDTWIQRPNLCKNSPHLHMHESSALYLWPAALLPTCSVQLMAESFASDSTAARVALLWNHTSKIAWGVQSGTKPKLPSQRLYALLHNKDSLQQNWPKITCGEADFRKLAAFLQEVFLLTNWARITFLLC